MDHFNAPPIGLALRRLRKKHRLTQKDLANGICSQAEISKIENGTHSPTVDLLFALSRRLQVPISMFLDSANQQDSIRMVDDTLLTRFRNQEFLNIYNEMKILSKQQSVESEWGLLYHFYFSLCAFRLQKIDYRTCIVELQNLFEKYATTYYSPSMLIRIKSAIANIYYENKSYHHGMRVYGELLNLNYDSDELMIARIRVLYNFSKVLLQLKKADEALSYLEEGIETSLRYKDMSLLGQLLYQKGSALEMLGAPINSIQETFTKAYIMFEMLGMTEYQQIMRDKQKHFLLFDFATPST